MDQIDALTAHIDTITSRVAELIAAIPGAWGVDADGVTGPGAGLSPGAPVLPAVARLDVCVPRTSSTSCDQAIFVDQATDASLSSDAVLIEIDRLGQWLQRCGCVQGAVRPVLIVATRGRTW